MFASPGIYVNASSKNWALGTLGQFHPPKVGIGAKCDSESVQNSHFKFFRLFIEGIIIWFLLHFYAIQAISHFKVFLRPHFYLMCSYVLLSTYCITVVNYCMLSVNSTWWSLSFTPPSHPLFCYRWPGTGRNPSLVPRPGRRRKKAWYLLHAHASTTPRKPGVLQTTVRIFALLPHLGYDVMSYRCSLIP